MSDVSQSLIGLIVELFVTSDFPRSTSVKPSSHMPPTVGDVLIVTGDEKFIHNNKALH